jgi:hypothetical protein
MLGRRRAAGLLDQLIDVADAPDSSAPELNGHRKLTAFHACPPPLGLTGIGPPCRPRTCLSVTKPVAGQPLPAAIWTRRTMSFRELAISIAVLSSALGSTLTDIRRRKNSFKILCELNLGSSSPLALSQWDTRSQTRLEAPVPRRPAISRSPLPLAALELCTDDPGNVRSTSLAGSDARVGQFPCLVGKPPVELLLVKKNRTGSNVRAGACREVDMRFQA